MTTACICPACMLRSRICVVERTHFKGRARLALGTCSLRREPGTNAGTRLCADACTCALSSSSFPTRPLRRPESAGAGAGGGGMGGRGKQARLKEVKLERGACVGKLRNLTRRECKQYAMQVRGTTRQ
eukprot:3705479-Pleurochrysis_carterae.AAC.1